MSNNKFTPQQEKEITARYLNGETSNQLSKLLHVDRGTISDMVKRNGGLLRENKTAQRLYPVDDNIFDICDSEGKAYWLGFMYADGSIGREKTLVIDLAYKDVDHVEKFKKFMGVDNPLRCGIATVNGVKHMHVAIGITSKHMCKTLIDKYGMKPKNKKMNNLFNIPEYLRIHWIRGFFDGNGCTTARGISFIGKDDSEIDFIINFFNTTGTRHKIIHKSGMIYWRIGGIHADKVLHRMYDNATIFLERKSKRRSRL